jgi:alpha-glucosidase (family GH31 glycosyl hydrolase)
MHAVRITVICPECVRIEYAPHGRFCDHPSLFAIHAPSGDPAQAPPPDADPRVCRTTSADAGSPPIVVQTPRLTLTYTPDGRPPHEGNMHALISHPSPPTGVPVRDGRILWTPESRNLHNLGGTLSTLDGLRAPLPLGQGLLARDGWHVVDDSPRHLLIDGWAATREHAGLGHNTDWYLFAYGDDYAAALGAFAVIAGRVPMPRRCALGAWYSRYWPYTSDEFRGIVDEFDVHGFPLDVLVLDMDWHKDGWTGWSWNRTLLPDAEDLLGWLHARGLAVTLNLHPADGVGPHEDRYREFMRALGREPDGSTVPFDAGDRAYMRAIFEQVHRPLEHPPGHPESGVDFWWVDWQQDAHVRSIPGLTNLRWLNHLYFQHTTREPSATDPGLRGLSFSRWAGDESAAGAATEWGTPATGGWGDHRAPIHFSGDAHTGWDMLAFQVPFTAAAGNIGCFFWSHDIGGHFGPRIEEAAARWVQFGALSAALRLHSARAASLDRRPWTYEPRFRESMRQAFDLRARLMPYLYTCVRACHERTLPLLRPMYLGHPRRERAYLAPGQYTLGDDLLVAPVVARGLGERCVATRYVWFPPDPRASGPGPGWHNLLTGERHAPDEEAIVAADIDRTPVFLRSGVLLPAQPPTRRMATQPLRTLVLHAFPGEHGQVGESALYEDDGLTRAHELGASAATPLAARWTHALADGRTVVTLEAVIGPTRGEFAGQPAERAVELRLGAVHRVAEAAIDGKPVAWSLDPEQVGGLAVVRAASADIRAAVRVRVVFEPVDPRLIAHRARLADFGAALGAAGRGGREIGTTHLRDALLAAVSGESDADRRAKLLAIGAGIGAVMDTNSVRFVDSLGWIDGGRVEVEIMDRIGSAETRIAGHALALEPTAAHARAASVVLPDAPLPAPPLGLRASRLARFYGKLHGAAVSIDHVAHTKLAPLTEFMAAGPFEWDWRRSIVETVYPPEASPVDPGAAFVGRAGKRFSWVGAGAGPKWPVDLRATLGERGGLGYCATLLHSPTAQTATLHFECGDKLEAFLNGTKIITLDDHGAHGSPTPAVGIALRAGRNELLVKATDGGGGWGFAACIEGAHAITHEAPIAAR